MRFSPCDSGTKGLAIGPPHDTDGHLAVGGYRVGRPSVRCLSCGRSSIIIAMPNSTRIPLRPYVRRSARFSSYHRFCGCGVIPRALSVWNWIPAPNRYAVYGVMEPDKHMETLAFGVTMRAARPNITGVCGRNVFHSEQKCTEQLCRQARRVIVRPAPSRVCCVHSIPLVPVVQYRPGLGVLPYIRRAIVLPVPSHPVTVWIESHFMTLIHPQCLRFPLGE